MKQGIGYDCTGSTFTLAVFEQRRDERVLWWFQGSLN